MGWTFTRRLRGQSTAEFFRQEFGDGVLDAAAALDEAYVAYEARDRETGSSLGVFCVVCLIRWRKEDYFNFGYKDVSEADGPCCCDCPERILRRLTPFDFGSEEANRRSREWRTRCWQRLEERKRRPRLTRGTVIRFAEPLEFRSGDRIAEFVVVSTRPLRFRDARYPSNPARYQIRRDTLREREWQVVGHVGGLL